MISNRRLAFTVVALLALVLNFSRVWVWSHVLGVWITVIIVSLYLFVLLASRSVIWIAGLAMAGLVATAVVPPMRPESAKLSPQATVSAQVASSAVPQHLELPTFPGDATWIAISMGANRGIYAADDFRNQTAWVRTPRSTSGIPFPPIGLSIEGGRLFVSATLINPVSGTPVVIKHNVPGSQPSGWDYNSNNAALEFVDNNHNAVLQLIYRKRSTVEINGIFRSGRGGAIFVDEHGATAYPISPRSKWPSMPFLKPIFKYPSWQHPGEYATP